MPKTWSWNTGTSGGGGGGEPTGPAGGSLKGTYPNPGIANEAVTAEAIGPEAVTESKIKNLAVSAAKLAANAVETAKIKASAVTAEKLGAEAVETGKIKLLAITEGLLAAEAVTTAKIKLLAITEGLLASEAVTAAKIATGTITKVKLATAVQEELAPKLMERTFAYQGEVKAEQFAGFFVKLGTGEKKKLVAAEYKIVSGTAVKVEVQKNGTEISAYKALAAKTTAAATESSVELEAKDFISIKTSSPEGTPTTLSVSLFIESVN